MNTLSIPEWRQIDLAEVNVTAPTMLVPDELRLLYSLGKNYFRNQGCVVDAGCFLGGSTQALAHGVSANPIWLSNQRTEVIHSYDRFLVEPYTIGRFFPNTTPLNSSFESAYRSNIEEIADLVVVHTGDIQQAAVPFDTIEILFIDVAKHWSINDYLVRSFFKKLAPARSVVVQQDYLFNKWNGWLMVTMEYFNDYFDLADHTEVNSAVFLYKKEIPAELLQSNLIESLSLHEIHDLATRNIERFPDTQQEILTTSLGHLLELLQDKGWRK